LPPDVQKTTSPSTLFQMFLLWNHKVATMDRRSFGQIGAANLHYLRLSIATGLEDLKIGMQRMADAIADQAGFEQFIKDGAHFA
jgi:aspartate aminotransferase